MGRSLAETKARATPRRMHYWGRLHSLTRVFPGRPKIWREGRARGGMRHNASGAACGTMPVHIDHVPTWVSGGITWNGPGGTAPYTSEQWRPSQPWNYPWVVPRLGRTKTGTKRSLFKGFDKSRWGNAVRLCAAALGYPKLAAASPTHPCVPW